ncbi:pyrimidine/purine nucleoside phosphorylase [Jiulongibacter sediminis]|uniref:Pyrimidine/purine nucleoside phosphorylase n=1 Tax=Jiulongibacter sediminis TaxID=1605367 RepID=A0A0P7BSF1_9BACT|nr:pyrimidine/purine nucleoside phosphorylase [Jiulongibacter sediminis]KPM47869.1 hypothetical protein AFM12_11555 [Jiulongibacter sediminis]TBX24053.1 hypothetical protein TK44_11560 [Jiulongibacter sediminis]
MIKANEYFEGNVKSLGFATAEGDSSVGVMEAGEYTFGTGKPEIMHVIEGEMSILLKGETEWKTYKAGEHFNVEGNSSFDVKTSGQTAYLCQYR